MYSVVEKYQKNKWIVRVEIDETRTQFFKFEADPTQAEIDTAVNVLLQGEAEERQRQVEEQELQDAIDRLIEEVIN